MAGGRSTARARRLMRSTKLRRRSADACRSSSTAVSEAAPAFFKALALGATAVCIGRPYVYGLAISGEAGVRAVLRNMIADLDLTMGTAGCASIAEINRDMLVRV
jgi:FMN-dependent dehydrogenase